MSFIDKSAEIDIPCPHCGHKMSKTIGWIKTHKEFPCEGSGCPVVYKAEDLIRTLKEVDQSISDFGKQF